jgi:hypothetical protein
VDPVPDPLLFFSGSVGNRTRAYWRIVPATDDDGCGEFIGMIGTANLSTRRKPVPVSLCTPQIPNDLTPGSNPVLCDGKSV